MTKAIVHRVCSGVTSEDGMMSFVVGCDDVEARDAFTRDESRVTCPRCKARRDAHWWHVYFHDVEDGTRVFRGPVPLHSA